MIHDGFKISGNHTDLDNDFKNCIQIKHDHQ